jgi:long-chain fatty acid transport protein
MLDIGMFNTMVNLPPKRVKQNPGFHDIFIPRLGVEYRARDWERVSVDTRFGYVYEPTPIPRQDGESNLADSDKHTFSLGAGVELRGLGPILPKPLSIDLYFATTYLPERRTRKSSPLDPTGDFSATGAVVHCGLDLRTRF